MIQAAIAAILPVIFVWSGSLYFSINAITQDNLDQINYAFIWLIITLLGQSGFNKEVLDNPKKKTTIIKAILYTFFYSLYFFFIHAKRLLFTK